LSEDDVDVPSVNCFKNRLEKKRNRQMDFFKDPLSTSPKSCARIWKKTIEYMKDMECQG